MQFRLVVDITGAAAVAPYPKSDESFQVYDSTFGYIGDWSHKQMIEQIADKICKLPLIALESSQGALMTVDLVRQCLITAAQDIRNSQSFNHEFMYTIDTHNGVRMPTIRLCEAPR